MPPNTYDNGTERNKPTTPGRPAPKQPGELPDLTIYSVLEEGQDDTDPEPFRDSTTQPRACVLCHAALDHRDCITPNQLHRWLAMHMPADQANAIVSAVLASR